MLGFKHRTNKEITGLSHMKLLAIQALKTPGKTNINFLTVHALQAKLPKEDKIAILKEAAWSTGWGYGQYRELSGKCGSDTGSKVFTL